MRLVQLHEGRAEPDAPASGNRPVAHALFQEKEIGLPLGDSDQVSFLPIGLDQRLQAFGLDREIADLAGDIDPALELVDHLIDPARFGQRFRQREGQS